MMDNLLPTGDNLRQPAPAKPRPLQDVEREAILAALEYCNGNIAKAAKVLGITKHTLYRRIDEYDLPFKPRGYISGIRNLKKNKSY